MNKRILLIAGAVCILATAVFFGFKTYSEATLRGKIETFLANLPAPIKAEAEKIEVSLLDKSIRLINVKGSYTTKQPDTGKSISVDFSTDRIDARGVDLDAFKSGTGVTKIFASLTFRNAALNSPLAKGNIKRYHFEDVFCDVENFYKEFTKALPSLMASNASPNFPSNDAETKKLFTDLGALTRAYETLHIGRIICENYTYAFDIEEQKVDLNLGTAEMKDYSIRKMGPATMNKLTVNVDGSPLMNLERMSMDGLILPSFTTFFDTLAATKDSDLSAIQNSFKGQTFSLQNLRLKNLAVFHPEEVKETLLSFGELAFSYTAETSHAINLDFNNLDIPKKLILEESQLPPATLASLPETILLHGGWQQTVVPKESSFFDLDCKKIFLRGPGLGEISVTAAIDNVSTIDLIMGTSENALLKGFDLAITDAGLSDVAFALNGFLEDKTGVQARADEVASLRQEDKNASSPIAKELLNNLIGFIEKPGRSLRVVFAPEKPMNMRQLTESFIFAEPAAIGLSVSVKRSN